MSDAMDPDHEELLDFFLRLTQTELPRLVAIFSPGFVENRERQKLIRYTLDTLVESAHAAGYPALFNLFTELREHLPQSWPIPDQDRRHLVALVAEIRRVAETLETEDGMGIYTGSRDLAEQLDQRLAGEVAAKFEEFYQSLRELTGDVPSEQTPARYTAMADIAAALWQLMECSGTFRGSPVIFMASDLFQRAATNQLEMTQDLLEQLADSAALAENYYRCQRTGQQGPPPDLLVEHLRKLRICIKKASR